jgi:hypothetical protein
LLRHAPSPGHHDPPSFTGNPPGGDPGLSYTPLPLLVALAPFGLVLPSLGLVPPSLPIREKTAAGEVSQQPVAAPRIHHCPYRRHTDFFLRDISALNTGRIARVFQGDFGLKYTLFSGSKKAIPFFGKRAYYIDIILRSVSPFFRLARGGLKPDIGGSSFENSKKGKECFLLR